MPEPLVEALIKAFPESASPMETPFDVPQVAVKPAELLAVCRWLKADGFEMLSDVAGVDYLPRTPRFEVVYHLLDLESHRRIRLRVQLDGDAPEVPSVGEIWPSAWAAEREVYDLFGIGFTNHPDLRRILMPDDWDGHPLRKDYPLQGPRGAAQKPFPAQQGRFHAPKLDSGK